MAYRIEILPSAQRQLAKIDRVVRKRCGRAIDRLAAQPRPPGVTKLTDEESLWRIRVGDYRITYEINDRVPRVLVVRVGHRRDVYR